MITYHVNFLGIPSAQPKGANVELRSKKTWAVLASLVLSNPLSTRRLPTLVSRQFLAERLWKAGGPVDPRTSLRQCVKSLQDAFPNCILAGRSTIQVVPGRFISDIDLMLSAYEQAKDCPSGRSACTGSSKPRERSAASFWRGVSRKRITPTVGGSAGATR